MPIKSVSCSAARGRGRIALEIIDQLLEAAKELIGTRQTEEVTASGNCGTCRLFLSIPTFPDKCLDPGFGFAAILGINVDADVFSFATGTEYTYRRRASAHEWVEDDTGLWAQQSDNPLR